MRTAPADPLLGMLLEGRYRVDQRIGQGGFGAVYKAFHLGLGAPVAIKVLRLAEHIAVGEADRVGAFLEEARILKRLRHPHIVAALDAGLYDVGDRQWPLPYLVMEWCGGPSLKQLLAERRGEPMSAKQAWALLQPIVEAVAYAHSAGVVHRDIKPSNVLLAADEQGELRPRLIDFGIAKLVHPDDPAGTGSTQTAAASRAFTRGYAAPEQLLGARTGPWTDVYALGLLFVELLIGHPAVESDDADAQLAALGALPPTPAQFGVEVGPLEPVLARALSPAPRRRYASASALAAAIDGALASTEQEEDEAPSAPEFDIGFEALALDPSTPTSRTSTASKQASRGRHSARPMTRRHAVVGAAIAVLSGLTIVGAQRSRGGWPFAELRLQDLSDDELARRVDALGLGACVTQQATDNFTRSCGDAIVQRLALRAPSTTLDAFAAHTNEAALALAQYYGAAKFAVDGDVALIVAAKPHRVDEVFRAALGEAKVERAADAEPPPLPGRRSAAADRALAAWSGADLISSVAHTGKLVTLSRGDTTPALAMVLDDHRPASVLLYDTPAPRAELARARATPGWTDLAYALDGERLLLVIGGSTFPARAFLDEVLAGARAAEVGAAQ